jgi:hypothetical protein
MFLAILLIIVALLVFYNELDSKMNISEYILLFIALIVIIGASINYINIDKLNEGFTSKIKTQEKNKNSIIYNKNDKEDDNTMILNSEESSEYLDSDEMLPNPVKRNINTDSSYSENNKNINHINKINDLLGISNSFTDIPIPTNYNENDNENENEDDNEIEIESGNEIKSVFNPKVIIGKGNKNTNNKNNNNNNNSNGFGRNGNSSKWNNVFNDDGFGFDNTMNPVNNLWNDTHSFYNGGNNNYSSNYYGKNDNSRNDSRNNSRNDSRKETGCDSKNNVNSISNDEWSQNMDCYNKGKWQRNQYNRPSDYVDYITPPGYGSSTPNSSYNINGNTSSESINNNQLPSANGENKKLCGAYTDFDENQEGDLIIKDYTQSKKWVAGYTYVPPVHWDVPQKHAPVCSSATPKVHKLTGLIDRGLPINALELTPDGYIADTEDTVELSNVGSMIPKFNYQEQPFSKPYV